MMIMDLSTSLPATVTGVLGLFVLYNLWRKFRCQKSESKLLAPEPSGALPFIGHIHLFLTHRTVPRTLAAIADKYGPVFTIRLGRFRTLVVSNHEAVKECFTINDRVFANRPISNGGTYLGYDQASFGFSSYGPYWREIRKLAVVELLSLHRVTLLKHVQLQVSEVNAFIKNLYLFCEKNEQVPNQKISIGPRLDVLIVNMMMRVVAGKRYFSDVDGEADEEAKRVINIVKEFPLMIANVTAVSEVFPFLKWMDKWSSQVKSMERFSKDLDSLIETWVDEHKLKRLKMGSNGNNNQDFIDVMLSKIKDDHCMSGHSQEKIIKATITMLFAAGIDTTALEITWILSNLMNNRHALKRAQEELDLEIGRDRWAEDFDMEKLVYLQAIIKETFRLYPPAPLLIPHVTMEDCCVSGYRVPKGTRLFVNAWKMHRDPRIWSNPEEFEPERFLTRHENVDVLGQNFELIPFGTGRRSCPGTSWALQAINLTMARLLQGFDLTTPLNAAVDMTEERGASVTMPKATPLELVLTPRLPHHLYQL